MENRFRRITLNPISKTQLVAQSLKSKLLIKAQENLSSTSFLAKVLRVSQAFVSNLQTLLSLNESKAQAAATIHNLAYFSQILSPLIFTQSGRIRAKVTVNSVLSHFSSLDNPQKKSEADQKLFIAINLFQESLQKYCKDKQVLLQNKKLQIWKQQYKDFQTVNRRLQSYGVKVLSDADTNTPSLSLDRKLERFQKEFGRLTVSIEERRKHQQLTGIGRVLSSLKKTR